MDKQPDSGESSRSFKSDNVVELIRPDDVEDLVDPPDMINSMVSFVFLRKT